MASFLTASKRHQRGFFPRGVAGVLSTGSDKLSAGVCSEGVAGVAAVVRSLGGLWSFSAGGADCGDGDPLTLPRMMGKPSLLLPTITILELDDCAS